MFKGESVRTVALNGGFVELCFDRSGDGVNKFDRRTVHELKQALADIASASNVRGVLITSAKQSFIVGAHRRSCRCARSPGALRRHAFLQSRAGDVMGPAHLNDVVGMDTGVHVAKTICAGFPQRLRRTWKDPLQLMVAHGRLGRKSAVGFYRYVASGRGRPVKQTDPEARALIRQLQVGDAKAFADQEIIERMMLPLLIEAARCLEEAIVASASELDLALVLGLGFPAYLGGALKYADWLGPGAVVELSDRYADLGPQYIVTPTLRAIARSGDTFYGRN